MKKYILSVSLFVITAFHISAQNIGTVFLAMPENFIIGLEATQKDKLISNPKDTSVVAERGVFGKAKRLAISDDFISIRTSEAGITQIKLLPLVNDSKIICVVRSVCAKACDSQIQFYTTKWIPIPQQDLFPKKNKDWFIKNEVDKDSEEFKNAYTSLDMNPMTLTLSPENTSITVSYDIKNYLSESSYKGVEAFLNDEPKVFNWDKVSYK